MNIRSIDLQVLIPRATEVSRMQQNSDHQNSLQQQQFAEQLKQITTNRQQKVQNTPKNAGPKIKDEERQKRQQRDREEEKKGTANRQDTPPDLPGGDISLGHSIDIKT